MLFFTVIFAVLLAIIIVLIPGSPLTRGWEGLGLVALFLEWLALFSLAALCAASKFLSRLTSAHAAFVSWLLVLVVILILSEAAFQIVQYFNIIPELGNRAHGSFLLRTFAIGAIVSGMTLRYLYMQQQWREKISIEAQSRIQALQARMRPHFLFNAMKTIAALTRNNPGKAEEAIENLSGMFRASLRDDGPLTTLNHELDLVKQYLALETHRLGDRLKTHWQVEVGSKDIPLPPLTLQPLVENAIYHGIETLPEGGVIEITARSDNDILSITIRNPLPSEGDITQRQGNRMALANTRERLALAFGKSAALTEQQNTTHYQVQLVLPVKS